MVDSETGTLTRHPVLHYDLCMFSKTLKKMSEILTEIRDSHKCDCFALENDRDPIDYPFYSKHSHNMWLYAYTKYLVEYSTHTYSVSPPK